jgi:hypothetical protein
MRGIPAAAVVLGVLVPSAFAAPRGIVVEPEKRAGIERAAAAARIDTSVLALRLARYGGLTVTDPDLNRLVGAVMATDATLVDSMAGVLLLWASGSLNLDCQRFQTLIAETRRQLAVQQDEIKQLRASLESAAPEKRSELEKRIKATRTKIDQLGMTLDSLEAQRQKACAAAVQFDTAAPGRLPLLEAVVRAIALVKK